jgi:hypothetical protein
MSEGEEYQPTDEEQRHREHTGRLMYEEAKRARDLQERRVDGLKSRATTLLTTIGSAVVIVAGVADHLPDWSTLASLVFVAVAAVLCFDAIRPRDSIEGPNVDDLAKEQFANASPPELVLRDLAHYHWEAYTAIEEDSVNPIAKSVRFELVAAALALLVILVGLGV